MFTVSGLYDPFEAGLKQLQTIGILQVICEVIKSGSAEQVQSELAGLLSILQLLQKSSLANNTVVRKYRTKLVSRLALRLLPTVSGHSRKQGLYPNTIHHEKSDRKE